MTSHGHWREHHTRTLTLEQPFNTKVELRASKPKEGEIGLSLFLLHEAPDLTLC